MDEGDPIAYTALAPGVPVYSADGESLGTVHRVLDNAREHIFDGIVVDTPGGRRFVDAPEVGRITDRGVTLTIDAAAARELPAESSPVRDAASRLRRRFFGDDAPAG